VPCKAIQGCALFFTFWWCSDLSVC
jgi:hypothetical protein